jgi:proton-translocating NADH-quinone oxidoreductase chain N
MTTETSIIPAITFLLPIVAGVPVLLWRGIDRRLEQGLPVAVAAFDTAMAVWMVSKVLSGSVLTTWHNELRVDGLSALMVLVIGLITLLVSVYSIRYMRWEGLVQRFGEEVAARRMRVYHGLLLWFFGTMLWGSITNNIVMLYVAIEATTLTSGLLVAFHWDRRALEAGYKYLMLLTIGIIFALFGCVLIYAAAASTRQLSGSAALLISEVRTVARFMPHGTTALAVAFLVIGFGTKAGIAPFHPWLPDAHAEAPTPISVLLSGVMIKMALYAMVRTVSIFYPSWPQVAAFLVALGAFTMVFGVLMAFSQDDLKRLLAYSSVSQMGYILAGVGLGTYLGYYGGLFHLLNHALFKSLLFLSVGAVMHATGTRRITELGGLGRRMPITSVCFFLGALAISGLPPLNGFWSKLTIYLALAQSGLWWAAIIAVGTSILTMAVLIRAGFRVFWGEPHVARVPASGLKEAPVVMWLPMAALGALCLLLGLYPQAAYPLLDRAATALAASGM